MSKRFALKYLTQFVAKMYNKECPEYYAGHLVTEIRRAIIEMFNVNSTIFFNVGNEDIMVEMTDKEHNWTFKQYMHDCEDKDEEYVLNNLNILWDTIHEFKNNY